jgi:glycosyltransferase involved in cell wall biosynthesis
MIVKNESKIIERCLNSAKPIIDFVSICDTGSTDSTPDIIKNWCAKNNIPGTVHYEPFKNFGYNRTLAVSLAQQTYPEADYLLLLDADMILKIEGRFDKRALDKDQYLTPQQNRRIKYWLTRLLKASLPWRSVGVTHEYWDLDRSKMDHTSSIYLDSKGKIASLFIDDQEDGGSKADKYERDKRLLIEGLNDPETPFYLRPRYMFYLAQSYMCLQDYHNAIKWYKKRVEEGGWVEEVYYSLVQIALCYEELAKENPNEQVNLLDDHQVDADNNYEKYFSLSLLYFQKAWEYRPVRAEPLYHLARLHRIKGNYNLGLLYALKGSKIPFPSEDILFVDYHVYDYLFDYEISICAYYVKNKIQLGKAAQKRLEAKFATLPDYIAETVRNNARYYKK